MVKRIGTLLLFALIIWVGYTQKDILIETIRAGGMLSVLASILFVVLLVFFPIMPFIAVAGIIGAVFGVWTGTSISLIGSVLGSLIMFGFSRFGFRDWADRLLQKYPKVQEYESYFEKNAFMSILFVRIVPIIPSPAVNVISGVSHVHWLTFLLATLLGKIPAIFIFTFAGSTLESNKMASFLTYGIYFVTIFICILYYNLKRQKQSSAE